MNPKPQAKLFWLGFSFMTAALCLMGLRLLLSFEATDKKVAEEKPQLINNLYKGRDLSHLKKDEEFKIPPAEKQYTAQHYKALNFAPAMGSKNSSVRVDLFVDFSHKDSLKFLRDFQPLLNNIKQSAQIRVYSFNTAEINSIIQLAADKSDFNKFYADIIREETPTMEDFLSSLINQGLSMADIRNALKKNGADYYGQVVQMTSLKNKLLIPNTLKNSPALLLANGYLFGTTSLSYDDFENSVEKLKRGQLL